MKKKINFLVKFFRGDNNQSPDWCLMIIILFLAIFGLIILASASAFAGFQQYGDSYWFVKHQLWHGFLPGIFLFFILIKINYLKWRSLAVPILILSILGLILVFVPNIGHDYGKLASRWIRIFGFSIQPSEFIKLTFLIYLASWLSLRDDKKIKDFYHGFLPFISVFALVVFLVLKQPDLSTTGIIVAVSLTVYFVAGAKLWHLISLAAVGLAGLFIFVKMKSYQMQRLMVFLNPELDPLASGYHINQALLAIGSGGWFGRGFGYSRQKFAYLPEVAGDSIFAVIAEELGFFISIFVVLAFVILIWRGLRLANRCHDPFGRLMAVGIVTWFGLQAFFNISSMIGLIPLTGLPLPFISYGGSSLVSSFMAAGILVNISKQVKNH